LIDVLKKAKASNCDALVFIPNKTDENVSIAGLQYSESGEVVTGGCGDLYNIILFRGDKDKYHSYEEFEAVLVCPFTYCNRIFKESYYGIIAKITSTSKETIDLLRSDLIKEFNLE